MPSPGRINDRGFRGLEFEDKRLKLKGASHIEPQGSISVFEDFVLDSIAEDVYQVNQAGTPVAAAAISVTAGAPTAGHGGWIAGATQAIDANIVDEVALGSGTTSGWMIPSRAGNGVIISEVGFVIPTALTARQYFAGLTDDPTEGTADGSLSIGTAYTLTATAADAAGFIFSSLATAPTLWKWASANATAGSTVSAATETSAGVVDAYTVVRVEVDSAGNAYFYFSTSGSASVGRQAPNMVGGTALAVATTALLCPIFTAATTAATSVEWELDYMFGAVPR